MFRMDAHKGRMSQYSAGGLSVGIPILNLKTPGSVFREEGGICNRPIKYLIRVFAEVYLASDK